MSQRTVIPVTIASGTSLSAEVNVDRLTIVGIQCPPAMEGTAITFQALNADGTTFSNVHDQAGTEVNFTVAAGKKGPAAIGRRVTPRTEGRSVWARTVRTVRTARCGIAAPERRRPATAWTACGWPPKTPMT